MNASSSWRAQAPKENAAKILQHAEGRLFEAADVEADLGLSRNIVYPALRRLVAEKLTQLKLRPMGAFGHTLVKQCVSVPAVDAECDEAMSIRVGLKRLDAAEVQARLDSRQASLVLFIALEPTTSRTKGLLGFEPWTNGDASRTIPFFLLSL